MIKKTLCAIVAAATILGCQSRHTQQLNPPGIEISIGDLKGCRINFKDRDGNGVVDEVITLQPLYESGTHQLHDMSSSQYKQEVLHQLHALYPIAKNMAGILEKYNIEIVKFRRSFDNKDNNKEPNIKTTSEGAIIFKGISIAFDGEGSVIYDWDYDGHADMVLYKTDAWHEKPGEMGQCHFANGFKEMCKADNKIAMSEEMRNLADESLRTGLSIFSKFEKNIPLDRRIDDSYFVVGSGWAGAQYYNLSNVK